MQFKVTYGVEPPSGIVLHADQASWDRDRRNKGTIRQIWPRFDFTNCGGLKDVPQSGITLTGAECLVFFLGGVSHPTSGELIGFAKDQAHPFSSDVINREGPYFEFKGKYQPGVKRWTLRLTDQDHDGFPEYLDPLPGQRQPYLYASSYGGQGYRIEDLGGAMQDVYRDANGAAHKSKGLQIISAGADGKYGQGGLFDLEHAEEILQSDRAAERDNFTNFMPVTLCYVSELQSGKLITVGIANLVSFLLVVGIGKPRWPGALLLIVLQVFATGLVVLPMIMTVR